MQDCMNEDVNEILGHLLMGFLNYLLLIYSICPPPPHLDPPMACDFLALRHPPLLFILLGESYKWS